jgi:CRISPR-associated endonuclease Cas2
MSKKYGTLTSELLSAIGEATGFFEWPLPGTYAWAWKQWRNKKALRNSVYNLKRRGLISEARKNGKRFLELTSKGELESLLSKAILEKTQVWDKQWRLVMFDIPEDAKEKRNLLRALLKRNGFMKMQASVYVSPYPLNREALVYLKQSGLNRYIRIIRANEIDDDSDLVKKYRLV